VYAELTRLPNSLLTGLGVVFALLVYSDWRVNPPTALIGFLTGFFGTAASMMVNDYVDRHVDAVNKPWKPIPSGAVNPSTALYASIALIVLAVAVNAFASALALTTALVYAVLAYGYSFLRKHWWSHFIVSAATTAPVVYGYALAGAPADKLWFTALYAATIFLATTGREVVKAVMDMEGDKAYGYVTLPVKYGIEAARKAILAHAFAAPVAGILAGVIGGVSILYHALMLVASAIYNYSMLEAYKHVSDKAVLEKARKRALAAMAVGLLAFLLSRTRF